MNLIDRIADLIQKNPRAALNASFFLFALFVVQIALALYNKNDKKDTERIAQLEIHVADKDRTINSLRYGKDSAIQAGLLYRITELERNNSLFLQLKKENDTRYSELAAKNTKQAKTADSNNKLSRVGSAKSKEILNILKKEDED